MWLKHLYSEATAIFIVHRVTDLPSFWLRNVTCDWPVMHNYASQQSPVMICVTHWSFEGRSFVTRSLNLARKNLDQIVVVSFPPFFLSFLFFPSFLSFLLSFPPTIFFQHFFPSFLSFLPSFLSFLPFLSFPPSLFSFMLR